jgi:hypothetical protein
LKPGRGIRERRKRTSLLAFYFSNSRLIFFSFHCSILNVKEIKMSVAEPLNIRYVTDTVGKRKEVIVPYQTWASITGELEELREKQKILLGLQQACRDVKKQEKGELKEQPLDEFLDEL